MSYAAWRVAFSGAQRVPLIFENPLPYSDLARLEENKTERTHECVFRLSPDRRRLFREIVRQQSNFSFSAHWARSKIIEFRMPDLSQRSARTSLKTLRLY
jgi:hypothetical protein